jgi:hypothetical protein
MPPVLGSGRVAASTARPTINETAGPVWNAFRTLQRLGSLPRYRSGGRSFDPANRVYAFLDGGIIAAIGWRLVS